MPTTHKSRQFQPLSNNEDLDEELANDERKKEIKKIARSEMTNIDKVCFVKHAIMKVI
jgi:hypothetical protein